YPMRGGKIYFVEVPLRFDELDRVKGWLKRTLGRAYYRIGVTVIAPTFPFRYTRWVRKFGNPREQLIVDAGCGNYRIDDDVVCADLFDYAAVDVVCDLARL